MPGNVSLATATDVMPQGLCKLFTHEREYAALVNAFPDGTSLRYPIVGNSRKSWKLRRRLTPDLMVALRTFYENHSVEPFLFYDVFDPGLGNPIGSNYDPSGATFQGRYTVRFNTPFSQEHGLGRGEVGCELIELAQHLTDADVLAFNQQQSSGQLFNAGF